MSTITNNVNRGDSVTIGLLINKSIPTDTIFIYGGGINYTIAKSLDPTIEATHVANIPNLAEDVSTDPKDLDYIVLIYAESNEKLVLAEEWLQNITLVNSSDYVMNLNNVTADELTVLKLVMTNLGLSGRYTVTQK